MNRILFGCGSKGSTDRSRKIDRGQSVSDEDGEKQVAPIEDRRFGGEQILNQRLDLSE